jgi:DNA polymerase-3 subunit delta
MKKKVIKESIYNINEYLKDDSLLPIYFLYGEDSFTINNVLKHIEKKITPLASSDFDIEILTFTKENTVSQLMDLAYAFPFGEGKKIIIAKGFEKLRDIKSFSTYVNDPADFTHIVIAYYSSKAPLTAEPFKSLHQKKYMFEARELSGRELSEWMYKKAKKENLNLTQQAGDLLLEMVGNNKGILEMQLRKIATYTEAGEKITPNIIENLAEKTKEYSIFDLQNAIGRGNKKKALDYAYNLLNTQNNLVFIIAMLTKFIANHAKMLELKTDEEKRRELGNAFYYYKNNNFLLNKNRLFIAANALLEADIRQKTTNIDDKTNITILISEMLK